MEKKEFDPFPSNRKIILIHFKDGYDEKILLSAVDGNAYTHVFLLHHLMHFCLSLRPV